MLFCICFFILPCISYQREINDARSLVITSGGNVKFIIGLSIPVELPVSLSFVQNVQYQYQMIDNATQLSYLSLLRSSENLILSRNTVYKTLAKVWNNVGINGTACVLQMICEIEKFPLSHEGVLGQLVDMVFTPHKNTDDVYKEARKTGRLGKNCKNNYPHCKNNLLDFFTKIK